jgi:putative FmdB family regulatory protein
MPTYEYECTKCSNRYEKREGFDAPATQRCPKCRGKAQRVIQAPPIVFKGSGFYKTDSRGSTPSESSSSDNGSSSPSSTSDSSDSKPEKKSEAAATSSDSTP